MQNNLYHTTTNQICIYIPSECYNTQKEQQQLQLFKNQLPFYNEFYVNMKNNIKLQVHLRISFLNGSRMKPATLSSDAIHCMSMSRLMEIFLQRDYNNDEQTGALLVCNVARNLI